MLWQRTLAASFLAIGAQAGIGDLIAEGWTRNGSPGLERRLEETAKANLKARGFVVEARQSDDTGSDDVPLNDDGSINMDAWNEMVNAACRDVLRGIQVATNPSGACVCYNLPLLNNKTGTFEADLRLFQLSDPREQFQGIPQGQIEVELTYNGASVSEVNQMSVARLKVRQAGLQINNVNTNSNNNNNTAAGEPRLLQSYLFLGQVDKDRMSDEVTMAQLQALVMPIVTLKAVNSDGASVSTNVSSNEAAFVAGAFSKEVVMSSFRAAELAVEAEMALLRNGTVAFVLPGVQLMIFPIGLIITSIWLVLGLLAYGFGTYERYNFRETHRKRMQVQTKGGMGRI